MKFLHIKKNQHNNEYITIDSNSRTMDALYWFLIFNMEMVHCIDSFKEWANSDPRGGIYNEFSGARMINNSIVITTSFPNDEEAEVEITITKNAFVKMIDAWREIYLKLPKEVTIYFDGEQFTFDPVY